MEVLSPYERFDEGDWASPRISFSQDRQFPGRFSPKTQLKDSPEEEFSFNFSSSVNVDVPTDDSMLSADELFFNGKLRLLQNGVDHSGYAPSDDVCMSGGRKIESNPRCFSMTIESCRGAGAGYGSRAYMSLHNSRCSSPSRTMSMPRTTPTSPKSSASIISSSSSSAASISSEVPLSRSAAWISSSLTPSSASSNKYSSKFKDFFKLKKHSMSKDMALLPAIPAVPASADISRECPQSSGSASFRHSSRSFWPFSRSNSAGESKTTTPVVLPPPRRSNSAGEGKTTSSSLLPTAAFLSKGPMQQAAKDLPCSNPPSKGFPSGKNPASKSHVPMNSTTEPLRCNPAMAKKGLPPLPNPSVKKTGSFFASAHCGSDAAIIFSHHVTPSLSTCRNSERTSSGQSGLEAEATHTHDIPGILSDAENSHGEPRPTMDANPITHKGGRGSTANPARQVRRGSHNNASRNFARGSPGRRGVWASPGRGNGGRVSIRSLERGSISSKGHVRPKDMLSRDGTSVRISPVLNVGVPSLRRPKVSSKSKMFSLGNLFSKRERGSAGLQAPLPGFDSQSGE